MTCIAAIAHQGQVYMGGDSAGISGWDLAIRDDAKVFRNGEYLIGYTSSFRMGQVLRYAFEPPTPPNGENLHRFMCTRFVDSLREALKAAGFARKESDQESSGVFLCGLRGRLFRVESDYQVAENSDHYDAIGCGGPVALGALFATYDRHPVERLQFALRAAERWNAGVRGPFLVDSLNSTSLEPLP